MQTRGFFGWKDTDERIDSKTGKYQERGFFGWKDVGKATLGPFFLFFHVPFGGPGLRLERAIGIWDKRQAYANCADSALDCLRYS